jgi:uncharacterized membrane protein YhdT
MLHVLFNLGVVYLSGLLTFAFTTRKVFGPPMGFKRWAPLAIGLLWPVILVSMAHAHWVELKKQS